MHRSHPVEDPVRRWRRFGRAGCRAAVGFAALWFGAWTLLFRVAPAPAAAFREAPAKVSWWPGPGGDPTEGSLARDLRALWTPAAFALSTPAGFSHSLRRERAGLAPPVQAARPDAAFLGDPRPDARRAGTTMEFARLSASVASAGFPAAESVFPPRTPEPEAPRMAFSDGWESRLFSGIDLDFSAWTNIAWTAQVEMRFDAKGVPASMLVTQASGNPDVDRRLARSAYGWRLLEPSAPREGVVAWSSPVPGTRPPAASAGREAP